MGAKNILPGFGGQYTSETFTSSDTIGADTLDLSKAHSWSVQLTSAGSPAGTIDIQQSFDGTNWAVLLDNMATTNGQTALFDPGDGPFGLIRFDVTDITQGTVIARVTAFPKSNPQ